VLGHRYHIVFSPSSKLSSDILAHHCPSSGLCFYLPSIFGSDLCRYLLDHEMRAPQRSPFRVASALLFQRSAHRITGSMWPTTHKSSVIHPHPYTHRLVGVRTTLLGRLGAVPYCSRAADAGKPPARGALSTYRESAMMAPGE
jgi:hypothetical protein